MNKSYKISQNKETAGKPKHIRKDNIKIYLKMGMKVWT